MYTRIPLTSSELINHYPSLYKMIVSEIELVMQKGSFYLQNAFGAECPDCCTGRHVDLIINELRQEPTS